MLQYVMNAMNEFQDEYHVGIKYSCRYEIDDDNFVLIECRFKDFSPTLERVELESELIIKSDKDTRDEREVHAILPISGASSEFTLLMRDAYEVGNDPFTASYDDAAEPGDCEKYRVITGFKTHRFNRGYSKEVIHEKVREWTRDVAALILHSPLLKVERGFEWDHRGYDFEDLLFSKTKPDQYLKLRTGRCKK